MLDIDFDHEEYIKNKKNIYDLVIKDEISQLKKCVYNLTSGIHPFNKIYSLPYSKIKYNNKFNLLLIKYLFNIKPDLKNLLLDINNNYFFFEDPLSNACSIGNLEIVQFLTNLKNIHIDNYIYNTGFINACSSGNLTLVKYLISSNKNILQSINNDIALKYTCKSGNLELVKYILDLYKNIDFFKRYNINKNVIFSVVCNNANISILKFLRKELEMDFKEYIINNRSSINNLCKTGNLDIIKYLFSFIKTKDNDLLFKNNSTILENSCVSGNLELVKYIINLYPTLSNNFINHNINTIINNTLLSRNIELIHFIFDKIKNYDSIIIDKSHIFNICQSGSLELFKLYFEILNNINKSILDSSFLFKCLYYSCLSDNILIVKHIYYLQKNNQLRNNNYISLFNNACISGNLESVKFIKTIYPLLDYSFNNNEFIHSAYNYKQQNIVNYFIKDNPYLIYKYKDRYNSFSDYLDINIKIIQRWWKNIIYNPYNQRGKKFILKQIEWAY